MHFVLQGCGDMARSLIAIAFLTSVVTLYGLPVPTSQQYSHSEQLDSEGKYTVYWAYNDTHITFEVHVQTHGYVGFGISPNGKMYPSDVVVGWVKDGKTFFSDRHTTAHAPPSVDASQDWFLLHGEENEFGTILKFVRKFDTCDKDDLLITAQTVRLIYSYHPNDPASETSLLYHGAERRGAKSVSLLSSSKPPASFKNDDVRVLEFRNRNYVVPTRHTTYACTGIELPKLSGKHHIIEYEPVVTPGNEHNVHHMIVSRCNGSYPHLDMKTAICDDSKNEMDDWPSDCGQFALWAVGGGPFYFPDNAGYPIGGDDGFNFFMIQIHYDNPSHRSDIIDSSGMRIKLTSKLRQHDVGGLGIAHETSTRQVIPPQEKAFVTRAYCTQQCTTNGLTGMTDEVKVIAAGQHAHLLGVGVTTRHFRNGVELEPIMDDPYYDFNFQSVRPLTKERVIKPGDSFIVECTLNSMGRVNASFGGLSTHEEMCMTFLYVYPAPPLIACSSAPEFDTYNLTATTKREARHELYNKFSSMNWSAPGAKADFRKRLDESTIKHTCVYKRQGRYSVDRYNFVETVTPFNRTQQNSQTCQS